MIYDRFGNHSSALAELENALEIAETYGYVRLFDESPELDKLLNRAIDKKIHSQFITRLMASFYRLPAKGKLTGTFAHNDRKYPDLVEPLSVREIEVLQNLAKGLSPAEVAKRLYLSPNTLKAHTQNIYSKLDVHSRLEAIIKARELGLV